MIWIKDMVGPQAAYDGDTTFTIQRRNSGNVIVILNAHGVERNIEAFNRWQFKDRFPVPIDRLSDKNKLIFEGGSKTVHGSISAYECNTVFTMFYPYSQGNPFYQERIRNFLDRFTPPQIFDEHTIDRLTVNHPAVFVNAVTNSNMIFMKR